MKQVIIQHAARATKSEDGIIRELGFPVDEVKRKVSPNDYSKLHRFACDGRLTMRGAAVGQGDCNVPVWESVEIGDVALVAWHGYIRVIGEVAFKTRNRDLAKLMTEEGEYELIYFLRRPEGIHVRYADLNSVLGYKPNNNFQKFRVLDEDRSRKVAAMSEIREYMKSLDGRNA